MGKNPHQIAAEQWFVGQCDLRCSAAKELTLSYRSQEAAVCTTCQYWGH